MESFAELELCCGENNNDYDLYKKRTPSPLRQPFSVRFRNAQKSRRATVAQVDVSKITLPASASLRRFRHTTVAPAFDVGDTNSEAYTKHFRFKPKPPAFILFADLDGTFTPMDLGGMQDFVQLVQEIEEHTGAKVKFVPVSGRPSGYVLRVLHECRDILKGVGVHDACDYGASEQGAVIVDSSKSYDQAYLGDPNHKRLKAEIGEILANNEYSKIISDEPDKLYTCSIHIKNEAKVEMSAEQQKNVYLSVRKQVWEKFGEHTLNIAMSHNCMEVMHKEISKSYAMSLLLSRYQKEYNIVGLCMCGDAENDKIALNYVSRLAEIPGVKAHVLEPANAQEAVSTAALENWKNKNALSSQMRIRKGPINLFRGISWLIRDEMTCETLCDTGVTQWERSYDDLDMLKMKNDLL